MTENLLAFQTSEASILSTTCFMQQEDARLDLEYDIFKQFIQM